MRTGAGTVQNSMERPQHTEHRTTVCAAAPRLGTFHRKQRNMSKKYLHFHVQEALFTIAETRKTSVPISGEWIKKCYLHNGILISHKKRKSC